MRWQASFVHGQGLSRKCKVADGPTRRSETCCSWTVEPPHHHHHHQKRNIYMSDLSIPWVWVVCTRDCSDLTDVTLLDEDTILILTDDINRASQAIMWHYRWCHLVANFGTNPNSTKLSEDIKF